MNKFKNYSTTVKSNGVTVRIHCISTGSVKVKNRFRDSRYNDFRALIDIFLNKTFTDWMPIWVWVIEHPEGIYVIDTGENSNVTNHDYFKSSGFFSEFINRSWFRFSIKKEEEIGIQLASLSIDSEKVKNVIITHLHLDHTDGLKYFKNAQILVNKTEWKKPYGQLPKLFPKWLNPKMIDLNDNIEDFKGKFLTKSMDLSLIGTPGHTYGHSSVLFKTDEFFILFAGDAFYNEKQFIQNKFSGANVSKRQSKNTYDTIKKFCTKNKVILLPSHDESATFRLENNIYTKV